MNRFKSISVLAIVMIVAFAACKKDDETTTATDNPDVVKQSILNDLAANVIVATYDDMKAKANQLATDIATLNTQTTEANLAACRQSWLGVRQAWERSEGFLFGPVATNNIDPRIDTWPVNYQSLDSVLKNNQTYSDSYIESLEDGLRGFHPIEYILFGQDGKKAAPDFTQNQKDYLVALVENLKKLCNAAADDWHNGHTTDFTTPGGTSVYGTQREVYEELVNAMAGICDEVANGKIKEPYDMKDPSLEESPFALNSIKDFTDNIRSVENIYTGKYTADGRGMEDFVKMYNLSLHNKISQNIQAAINSLNNITVPFGQAITQQTTQVENAMAAINTLHQTLDAELLPLVQANTK
jgi:putative iron-regulated protein